MRHGLELRGSILLHPNVSFPAAQFGELLARLPKWARSLEYEYHISIARFLFHVPQYPVNTPEYLHGISLFNQAEFFEAHELLEDVW